MPVVKVVAPKVSVIAEAAVVAAVVTTTVRVPKPAAVEVAGVLTTVTVPTALLAHAAAQTMVLPDAAAAALLSAKYMYGVVMVMMPLVGMLEGAVNTMVTTPAVALLPTRSAAVKVRDVPMVI